MNQLSLRYRYDASYDNPRLDRDDFGWLAVSVRTEAFSGDGGFWVQWQDIREYGDALQRYPIPRDETVVCQWGYNMQEGDDLILRIEVTPFNSLGDLEVRAEIADSHEQRNRVRATFRTTYNAVDMFRRDIARLMDREIDEAVLLGRSPSV